jgi:two-component system NtrC family sensor kinase
MIEHDEGGTLTIRSRTVGDAIRVSVTDTGPGLSPEAEQHLFEPFFTTKEVGKGTGLGLSICFGIVDAHDGRVWTENAPGQGATFVVELPVVEPEEEREAKTEKGTAPPTGKRILVVEDDEQVATVLQRLLAEDDHDTLWAHDGVGALDALSRARKGNEPFELMISDVKMPRMSGIRLYERVSQENDELAKHTLFVTGDTMSSGTREFLRNVGLPYLTKPFKIEELRQAVARALREA